MDHLVECWLERWRYAYICELVMNTLWFYFLRYTNTLTYLHGQAWKPELKAWALAR